MSTIVYRISALLGVTLAEVPIGTNLGVFWLLWALISGRFLLRQGALFPALADGGLPADAVRRSGAALAYGRWAIQPLLRADFAEVPVPEDRLRKKASVTVHLPKGVQGHRRQSDTANHRPCIISHF